MTTNPATQFLTTDNDAQLIARTNLILQAMTGNPKFPSPMPELPAVAAAASTLATALADAAEGNNMDAVKHAARGLLVKLLRQLAGYVQVSGRGEMAILVSSGFPIQNPACQLIGPLPIPSNPANTLESFGRELYASVWAASHACAR